MINFVFFNENGSEIPNIDASGELPKEVASIRVAGPFESNTSRYEVFTSMLKNSPRILDRIFITEVAADSPEFLAFLVLICNKTKSLDFSNCKLSTNACSCLIPALLTRGGIRHLSLSWSFGSHQITTDEAKILFEGVASSPCLETFEFSANDDTVPDPQEVGMYLVRALNRNQSLKNITLFTGVFTRFDPSGFPSMLKAAILGANRKSVSIEDLGVHGQVLPLSALEDLLCRKDCTLEKLRLEYVNIMVEGGRGGSTLQNTSVTSLALEGSTISGEGEVAEIVSLFKSLEELTLQDVGLTKLSFLDPLLFGERSQLKSLNVSWNTFDEEEMKEFIGKLRKVKGLKHLSIGNDEEGLSDAITTKLIDALRNSTDLEHSGYLWSDDLPLDLNRGGRRLFQQSLQVPTKLLPRVLERASKISYYEEDDEWGSPSGEEARADVVFWMTKRIVPHL